MGRQLFTTFINHSSCKGIVFKIYLRQKSPNIQGIHGVYSNRNSRKTKGDSKQSKQLRIPHFFLSLIFHVCDIYIIIFADINT